MENITAIILTYNEECHIRRCIENLKRISAKVYVVDCFSTDKTKEIAESLGAVVVCHKWPGNQAEQFNWALDNLSIETPWILRLDADEYCSDELIEEIESKIPTISKDVDAIVLPRGREFMGRRLRYGITSQINIIRLFRYGKARYEKRVMDEHLIIKDPDRIESFENRFYDANLLPIDEFVNKHNGYAVREASILLSAKYGEIKVDGESYGDDIARKRKQKDVYATMPLFIRPILYFIYRYIIRLGFLDGKEGFIWDFMQGLWYRMLVDIQVYEISKKCDYDYSKIKAYLKLHYNIDI